MTFTYRSDSRTTETPWGVIESDDGKRYALTTDRLQMTNRGVEWPGMTDLVNPCSKCGRGTMIEVGPIPFEKALERGWIVELPK